MLKNLPMGTVGWMLLDIQNPVCSIFAINIFKLPSSHNRIRVVLNSLPELCLIATISIIFDFAGTTFIYTKSISLHTHGEIISITFISWIIIESGLSISTTGWLLDCIAQQIRPGWFGISVHWHKGWGVGLLVLLLFELEPFVGAVVGRFIGNTANKR